MKSRNFVHKTVFTLTRIASQTCMHACLILNKVEKASLYLPFGLRFEIVTGIWNSEQKVSYNHKQNLHMYMLIALTIICKKSFTFTVVSTTNFGTCKNTNIIFCWWIQISDEPLAFTCVQCLNARTIFWTRNTRCTTDNDAIFLVISRGSQAKDNDDVLLDVVLMFNGGPLGAKMYIKRGFLFQFY
jgi:hypothetical protein